MTESSEVIVCVGCNVTADCHREVELAIKWLGGILSDCRSTQPYFTDPEGENAGSTRYLNAVLSGQTELTAGELTSMFKDYEMRRGRHPEHKKQGRIIIDIDLVCHSGEIINRAEYDAGYFRTGYLLLMQ